MDNNAKLDEARRQAATLQQQLNELRARGRDPVTEARLEQELAQVQAQISQQVSQAAAPAFQQAPYVGTPYAPTPTGPGPHYQFQESRATMILVFGILSIVVCQFFGPFAWSMGTDDLRKMDAGLMDPRERGSVSAGRICGMIGTGLMILWLLAVMGMFVIASTVNFGH